MVRTPAFQAGDRGFEPRRPYYRLVNVFTAEDGSFGNELGVFMDGAHFDDAQRQAIATDLGYAETVFVDDAASGRLRIFTPANELPLAGHPLVGSAWVIEHELGSCDMLRPPAGDVPTWREQDLRWIRGRPEWAPPFVLREYGSADEVDVLDGAPDGLGYAYCWAWEDEVAGTVRARSFVPEVGVPEDEATGSAALLLGAELGRAFEVRQGKGSRIYGRPGPDGTIEVGGRVADGGEQAYGHD